MDQKIYMFYRYNPEQIEGGTRLLLFVYKGLLYRQDDTGVTLLGEDTPERRATAQKDAWDLTQEWEETRMENSDVNHPEGQVEISLQECLCDEYAPRSEAFLSTLPSA